MVTVAVPDCPSSSELVATMSIGSDVGAIAGAVYSPVESMKPQTPGSAHAAPLTDQITNWLSVPATLAANRCCPVPASVTLPG